jgi:hypothetical protein
MRLATNSYANFKKRPVVADQKGAAGSWGGAGRANPVWGRGGVGT